MTARKFFRAVKAVVRLRLLTFSDSFRISPPNELESIVQKLGQLAKQGASARVGTAHGGIISYNRANNLRLCVHLGRPWIMSRRLPSHMQFSHGPLLTIWHARQSSAKLFRQPEPLWTSTDHELMRGCLQLVMHVAWTSTAARPCAMQHVDFQRASVMRAGSLTRSQISRIDSPPLRPPRGLQPELW